MTVRNIYQKWLQIQTPSSVFYHFSEHGLQKKKFNSNIFTLDSIHIPFK